MELNQLNIFPKNYHRPDLVITYTLKKNKEIDMFKIWISNKEKENIEIIDYANKLIYSIIISNERIPIEQDIFYNYQMLFHEKKWKAFEKITNKVNVKQTLFKAPFNNYKELNKTYINEMYDRKLKEYINKYDSKR